MTDILQMARREHDRLLSEAAKLNAFVRYAEHLLTYREEERHDQSNVVGDEFGNSNVVWLDSIFAHTTGEIAGERTANS